MACGTILCLVIVMENLDLFKPFEVHTNESDFALRGVLVQENHPVTFERRKLSWTERQYTTKEKSC